MHLGEAVTDYRKLLGKRVRGRRALANAIASMAFCDNGAVIACSDILAALDADRGSGFRDPTEDEALLMVQGSDEHDGAPPPDLCVEHPALDALLRREMT